MGSEGEKEGSTKEPGNKKAANWEEKKENVVSCKPSEESISKERE